jgi:hypothetical protein
VEAILDEKASSRILSLAKEQQQEISDAEPSRPASKPQPQARFSVPDEEDEEVSEDGSQEAYDEDKYYEEVIPIHSVVCILMAHRWTHEILKRSMCCFLRILETEERSQI